MQRGWSSFADTRQKPNATSSIRTRVFLCFRGGVSAEMSIRSALAGTSTPPGFESGEGGILRETGEGGFGGREDWGEPKQSVPRVARWCTALKGFLFDDLNP